MNVSTKKRDRPWIMRTYAGHSSAKESNRLYQKNLAKGQNGLSVAFDLPTQTGYDPDHPLSKGEVGKVGVPISHIGDMRTLFQHIPLEKMNTSMTINATSAWLLSLYIALAKEQNIPLHQLRGTTQNDIIKEYLSRGTYIFPPAPSLEISTDIIAFTIEHMPKWNPINICSYHLQEAGATPNQEAAYALANAIAVLDKVKTKVAEHMFPNVVGRISFFVNAGIRFVEEICKLRAFASMWDRICKERYHIQDEKMRRFRYGVQVNSLGLTQQQPENNMIRIVLEMLAVTLSKDARARAIQLPAWNEALGLPKPWDQQWSLRAQQILAFESDLLDYGDLFTGNKVIEEKTKELEAAAWTEIQTILQEGGMIKAVENGYIKEQLVRSNRARIQQIESGQQIIVGVNAYREYETSPLTKDLDTAILKIDTDVDQMQIESIQAWKKSRDTIQINRAIDTLKKDAKQGINIMQASIQAAKAGVTTGQWAMALRDVFGEYRAPTGIGSIYATRDSLDELKRLREKIDQLEIKLGRKPKILIGKPGLDGHSNGAEQIAIKARDVGFDVVYEGIRKTSNELANSALEEGVHLIGLSILSGSHIQLVTDIIYQLKQAELEHIPVVIGGIIPDEDEKTLRKQGISSIYTPKDFNLIYIMEDLIDLIHASHAQRS